MTYQIHTAKFIVALSTSILFLACVLVAVKHEKPVASIVFSLLFILYFYVCFWVVGARVTVDETGVWMHTLGIKLKRYTWEEIKEVGVAGIRVVNGKNKTGSIYIYFSEEKMDDVQRHKMCLEWPPKKCIYLKYTAERFHCVQS